jgi:hypothetical protein
MKGYSENMAKINDFEKEVIENTVKFSESKFSNSSLPVKYLNSIKIVP